MRKIIGFKMMLGEWANELTGYELLDMYVTKAGVGNVKDDRLKSKDDDELPDNKMSDYDPHTTIMTFMFDIAHRKSKLPKYFIKGGNGIIKHESNLEFIYGN